MTKPKARTAEPPEQPESSDDDVAWDFEDFADQPNVDPSTTWGQSPTRGGDADAADADEAPRGNDDAAGFNGHAANGAALVAPQTESPAKPPATPEPPVKSSRFRPRTPSAKPPGQTSTAKVDHLAPLRECRPEVSPPPAKTTPPANNNVSGFRDAVPAIETPAPKAKPSSISQQQALDYLYQDHAAHEPEALAAAEKRRELERQYVEDVGRARTRIEKVQWQRSQCSRTLLLMLAWRPALALPDASGELPSSAVVDDALMLLSQLAFCSLPENDKVTKKPKRDSVTRFKICKKGWYWYEHSVAQWATDLHRSQGQIKRAAQHLIDRGIVKKSLHWNERLSVDVSIWAIDGTRLEAELHRANETTLARQKAPRGRSRDKASGRFKKRTSEESTA